MKHVAIYIILSCSFSTLFAQQVDERIRAVNAQISSLDKQRLSLAAQVEDLKLERIRQKLKNIGLPTGGRGEIIEHAAYILSYVEEHEQAGWVAHMILPDVTTGIVFRTNDFRPDPLVKTGSAVEEDYFLKKLKADSTYAYDGFGYDRGHLAPSADFRWSSKALSESYYYSNMSPQLADFNRIGWGSLEDAIRGYIYRNPGTELYVITGPVLENDLPVIERGINKVSIPKKYWKVVLDLQGKKAIGFMMPNQKIDKPLENYAVPVNIIEKETGLDFFTKIPVTEQEQFESQSDPPTWLGGEASTDTEPLAQDSLPRNHFNSIVARQSVNRNEDIYVCGTVVGARLSRAGNVLLNLDKQFPNQVFTVFIKKEDIINFKYDIVETLRGEIICVKGRVIDLGGTPSLYIKNEKQLTIY